MIHLRLSYPLLALTCYCRSTTGHFSRSQIASARAKYMEALRPLVKQGATDDQLIPITEELLKLNTNLTIPSIDFHIQKITELLQPYAHVKFLHWALSQGDNFYREDANGSCFCSLIRSYSHTRPGNYNGVFALLNKAIGFTPTQREQLKSMREVLSSVSAFQFSLFLVHCSSLSSAY